MFLLAVGVMCLTACAQKKGGERGPRQGGHMVINSGIEARDTRKVQATDVQRQTDRQDNGV